VPTVLISVLRADVADVLVELRGLPHRLAGHAERREDQGARPDRRAHSSCANVFPSPQSHRRAARPVRTAHATPSRCQSYRLGLTSIRRPRARPSGRGAACERGTPRSRSQSRCNHFHTNRQKIVQRTRNFRHAQPIRADGRARMWACEQLNCSQAHDPPVCRRVEVHRPAAGSLDLKLPDGAGQATEPAQVHSTQPGPGFAINRHDKRRQKAGTGHIHAATTCRSGPRSNRPVNQPRFPNSRLNTCPS
jgi:hypothetical protein